MKKNEKNLNSCTLHSSCDVASYFKHETQRNAMQWSFQLFKKIICLPHFQPIRLHDVGLKHDIFMVYFRLAFFVCLNLRFVMLLRLNYQFFAFGMQHYFTSLKNRFFVSSVSIYLFFLFLYSHEKKTKVIFSSRKSYELLV